MKLAIRVSAFLLAVASVALAQNNERPALLEAYPDVIQARLELAERRLQERLAKTRRDKLEGVLEAARLWKAGSTVTVAFRGGDDDLCAKLAAAAVPWTEHGNLKLSFRTPDGKLRRWSTDDKEFVADIRVDFHHPDGGFFSLVGTESIDRALTKPGEGSMNLEKFDTELPSSWAGTVLHEFGHALGFHHEHQHPVIPCDFRFDDDPGYVPTKNSHDEFMIDSENRLPGLYRMLAGPPNNWSKAKVDFNLEKLKLDSRMFLLSDFDTDSIMKYDFPSWMFRRGAESFCYTGARKQELSKTDKSMMLRAYPTSADEIRKLEDAIRKFKQPNPTPPVPK